MKKPLLMGSLLLISASVFPQQNRVKPAGTENLAGKINQRHAHINSLNENLTQGVSKAEQEQSSQSTSAAYTPTASWNIIGGSRNSYGVLVAESRPLQYNSGVNAVSFIHRCSATYTASPADNTGAIVAEISTDWGQTWDSTCFWSDPVNQGRYPGGAIYNPVGNTNINNAYIVGAGPVFTDKWIGNWFGSKKLGTGNYNAVASSTPGAMQFMSNTTLDPNVGKVDFARLCFTSTSDGKVRTLGMILKDANDVSSGAAYGYRGINMVKGTYNAGIFNWIGDSLLFEGIVNKNTQGTASTSDDFFMTTGSPVMAWNEAGTHGYAIVMGVRATPSNTQSSGYQPIVWRTSDGGLSWSLMPQIDFSSPTYSLVTGRIDPVESNTNVTIPFFNTGESTGAVVDANNKLHLFSTVVGTGKLHPDSVGYTYSYTLSVNSPTATYSWPHTPGRRPYIYDFMLDGSAGTWNYMTVDSMSSEAPGDQAGEGGFSENPYDEDGGTKLISDARIQAGRTPSGNIVYVSWAESDSNFVNGTVKYNVIPEIKTRLIDIQNTGGFGNNFVFPEVTVSKLGPLLNTQVDKKAVMHYMSPVSSTLGLVNGKYGLQIPFTVTHSQGPGAQPGTIFAQLTSNAHWYTSAFIDFSGVGVKENALGSASGSVLYPNPAKGNASLSINMKESSSIEIEIYTSVGQLVGSSKVNSNIGENVIELNLNNLSSGLYLVNVKVGSSVSTKKLIIE